MCKNAKSFTCANVQDLALYTLHIRVINQNDLVLTHFYCPGMQNLALCTFVSKCITVFFGISSVKEVPNVSSLPKHLWSGLIGKKVAVIVIYI